MKAVILAGGEGTRLRPLTSNQPKPMMPVANRPMMEHIVRLARRARLRRHRRHGRVPRQSHPHLLRRRLGLRRAHALRHRGLAARHRRLGAQRGRGARRDVPRDLRRRPHRHRPQRVRQGASVDRRGRVHRAEAGRRPRRVRHRDHPRGRLDRAVPREADVGPGLLRHDQHRHLRARARGVRLHPRGRGRRLLRRRVPGDPEAGQAALRIRRRGLLGGRRARSRRTCAPTRTSSKARSNIEIDGFRLGEDVWLGEGPRSTPTRASTVPRSSAPTASSRPAPTCASTRCSAATSS